MLQVNREYKELKEIRGMMELMVKKVMLGRKVVQVSKVPLDLQEYREQLVQQVMMEKKVLQVHKEFKARP